MPLRPHQTDALDAMANHSKGQIIVPTGGGKTMCMIEDAKRVFRTQEVSTIVVVAPRILLAEQLCSEFLETGEFNDVRVMHVHSGETEHFSSTKVFDIRYHNFLCYESNSNQIIFTTYHSLHRVQESNIVIDVVYFDEAHNSVQRNFFPAVEHLATLVAHRSFFFTATPKHSLTPFKAGMNDSDVYGNVICQVPAPKLVKEGYILPPKVEVYESRLLNKHELVADVDCEQMIDSIDNLEKDKVLICAKSTKQITNLVSQTDFCCQLRERGYNWMYITAKTGAVINGKKVSRDKFFDILNTWGKDDYTKFVVLHHSILSEGINVNGLEAVLFLRSMDYIGISQTIGRVIRKGATDKAYGLVCVPVYSKVGISTARKVEAVVDTIFNKGEAATSVVTK
jgi:superfamily II DNA or RNA helicase